jgi:SAM-dependent methyltransferase
VTGWGSGYVTDIAYDPGYYREQSPSQLQVACLLNGVAWDVPTEGAHYLELGCGLGIGALIIAASNPSWRVTALDFNPAHIAGARAMARDAGLTNIAFIEADLTDFAESPAAAALPEADIVTAHGVWSWVAPAVRQGIVRLLKAKLRAGGVFHVSYNALPGWQGMLAVQRVTREAGLRIARRSDQQAEAGMAVLRDLFAAEAQSLRADGRIGTWLAEVVNYPSTYLAHELMNANWSPCWHADVVQDLSAARLDWVGSAQPLENFPELAMSGPQRIVYEKFDDPMVRELIKDLCLARMLRHDIYVRGAQRLTVAGRDAALSQLTLALIVPLSRVEFAVEVNAGKAEFAQDFYRPVAEMMARGPALVADLLHAPGAVATRENPAELAGMLIGTRQAMVVSRPGAGPGDAAMRLNALLAERLGVTDNLNRTGALASVSLGAGLPCAITDLFVAGRAIAGEAAGDLDGWTNALAGHLGEESVGRVRLALEHGVTEMLPVMRQLCGLPARSR